MPALRNTNPPPAPAAPAPMLVPVGQHKGQQPLPLNRPFTLIGSTASARLYLPSKAVSRCHACIINTGAGLFVRDLASRTGTRVNGQAVDEADLREGDVMEVGAFTFRFTDPTADKARPPVLPAPAAVLEVDELDAPLPIRSRTTLIGRRETADISLTENAASSAHALLFVAEGKHLLRDLGSRTGTWVNGVKVHEHALTPGDMVRVGETTFLYTRGAGAGGGRAATATGARPRVNGEKDSEADVTATEVAPLIESGPAEPSLESAPHNEDAAAGNGASVGLLEMGEPSSAPSPSEPAPADKRPSGDDDGVDIPLAPLEEPRD